MIKNPDKMSQRELRAEVKELRETNKRLQEFIEVIDCQYDAMQQIKVWCKAYPIDIFTPPNWTEVRDRLKDDDLMTRVAAAYMRHVVSGIENIITECEKISTER